MKIMVLAGGNDQAALIQELRNKFSKVYIILIDMAENVIAAQYADMHIVESTMDLPKVKEIAQREHVDYIMTACGDQPLLTMSVVSEELGLPCYLSKLQVLSLTNKMFMKQKMVANGIPTSKFRTFSSKDRLNIEGLTFPLVVKPVDSNGSKGVRKVVDIEELEKYAKDAFMYTLSDTIIVEEFVDGFEISADYYVVDGIAQKVMWSQLNKYKVDESTQVIYQSIIPPTLSDIVAQKLTVIANRIAKVYEIDNSPLLIQAMINGDEVKVIEFSARLGGGAKYKTIKNVTGFNVLRANIESMLGEKPIIKIEADNLYHSRCHLYVHGGVFSAIDGLERLQRDTIVDEYVLTKPFGVATRSPKSSSDRVASVFISALNREELATKIQKAIDSIKVLDENGNDMLYREMFFGKIL